VIAAGGGTRRTHLVGTSDRTLATARGILRAQPPLAGRSGNADHTRPWHVFGIAFQHKNAQGLVLGTHNAQYVHMGLIDLILNFVGVLLWLSWRSIRFDPLIETTPATLIGTLRRAGPRRLQGWQLLAGLAMLLVLRGVLYQQVGPEADWTPKLNLFFVVLAFRGNLFLPALLFSVLSFARVLIICYFWVLVLVIISRRNTQPNPVLKLLRLHIGPVARWPWLAQVLLPLALVAGLWLALYPLLVQLEITGRVRSFAHLVEQSALVGTALYLSLQFFLPVVLFLHLISSYVYVGANALWDFVGATARNLLAPLRGLPLRVARFDFAPIVGVVLIFLLLHWLPRLILRELAGRKLSAWPQ